MKNQVTVTIFLAAAAALVGAGYVLGQQKPAPEVRRVVTKLDESGKAVVMIDERTRLTAPRPPNAAANVWVTDKSLPDFSSTDDRGKTKIGLMPPKSGTVFRVVDFAPESAAGHPTDVNYMMGIVGNGAPAKGRPPSHPGMHRTRTLDYAIIMSGEIDMLLDDSVVHFKAGDVVVQQATNHAWVNRGKEPCRVAFILIDSQEP
ncbi:MAG TPA: cupin domain-containing protein [Burkholderiales bacterium]|jgi:mannose-6-phosphate isomerase-like protein (cupin superfamily)